MKDVQRIPAVPALALLSACACLVPVWALDLLPFQDYSTHLFQVEVLAHPERFAGAPFETNLRIGPYAGFYLLVRGLAALMPVELAGRLFLTLYVATVVALAWRLWRAHRAVRAGAGAGLLLPFAMNQQYLLGNTNFFLALPLAMFALLDFDELLDRGPTAPRIARHAAWMVATLLFHPLVFLAAVGLTGAGAALAVARDRRRACLLAAPCVGLALYAATASSSAAGGGWYWMSPARALIYLGLMFADFRWPPDAASIPAIAAWTAILALLLRAARREGLSAPARRWLLYAGLSLLAVLVLPFGKRPDWTFVNMRVSAVLYFVLAVVAARIATTPRESAAVAALALVLSANLAVVQMRLGRELARIQPILAELPPGARVLHLVYARGSDSLYSQVFDPWLHVQAYDWLRRPTTAFPNMPHQPLMPVSIPPSKAFPAPPPYFPREFSWSDHAPAYDRFILCDPPDSVLADFVAHAELRQASGRWVLFGNPAPARPAAP